MKDVFCESSLIAKVGYNPKSSILRVQFGNTDVWDYHEVAESEYNAMVSNNTPDGAENFTNEGDKLSIGRYFLHNIKPHCEAVKVTRTTDVVTPRQDVNKGVIEAPGNTEATLSEVEQFALFSKHAYASRLMMFLLNKNK